MSERGPYEYLASVHELNQICIELDDEDLSDTLNTVIKLIAKPDIPSSVVVPLIVKLQAYAVSFKMKAKYYMLYNKDGVDAGKRKNTYISISEALKDLVDSLKYLAKNT